MVGKLVLKRGEERRLKAGHLWIYRDEIASLDVDGPGGLVHVYDNRGHGLGTAYANPESLIVARMLSRKLFSELKPAWWRDRLAAALTRREWLFPTPHYRWVHGEGDKLPGLVIDRFGTDLVIQSHTAGIDRELHRIAAAAADLIQPANIYLNNRVGSRTLEGLGMEARILLGNGDGWVEAYEGGLALRCSALSGQKTGFFYDQRPNRAWVAAAAKGHSILDVFCYVGAFSAAALAAGAAQVTAVDASEAALKQAESNIQALGFADRWRGIRGDALHILPQMAAGGERYDIVVCDPPAFVKRRDRLQSGLRGYRKLAAAAARLVAPGGMLCMASCSGIVSSDDFRKAVVSGMRDAGRGGAIAYEGCAGADHPWLPAMPETRYLKFLALMLD